MIPIYVINLTRSFDRRAAMEAELARAGVLGVFVRAVDGRRCRASGPLSAGETALTLSHRKIWRGLLASTATHAIVLEDDARLGADFAELARIDWSRRRFDLVKLETMFDAVWLTRRGEPAGRRALHELGGEHHGSAAYLISRAGAAKALAATRDLTRPVDIALFGCRAIESGAMRALQLVPAAVVQRHLDPASARFESTLESSRDAVGALARGNKPKGLRRIAREGRRIWEQASRRVRLSLTMRRARVEWE